MQFNMHEAKTNLSRLVERVASGEEVVIARAGKPVAKLVPIEPLRAQRRPGLWRGRVRIHSDFDELPEEISRAFEGRRP